MTQDEQWIAKWQEVIDFMETYHRNPSKHRIEEHLMLNWIKHNRKLMNAGEMKKEREHRTLVRKVYYNLSTKIRTGHGYATLSRRRGL